MTELVAVKNHIFLQHDRIRIREESRIIWVGRDFRITRFQPCEEMDLKPCAVCVLRIQHCCSVLSLLGAFLQATAPILLLEAATGVLSEVA